MVRVVDHAASFTLLTGWSRLRSIAELVLSLFRVIFKLR